MRLPFWVDYHYKLIRRDKTRLAIAAGWVVLAVMLCLVLIPEAKRHFELQYLAQTMPNRVAAAEKARDSVPPDRPAAPQIAEETVAECEFSSGAGIEAVTDRCLSLGVAVVGYRPFCPEGDEAAAMEALELKLDGLYPDIKGVLHWLENGPTRAEIRHLAVEAGEGGVTALVKAVQRVRPGPGRTGETPDFTGRTDIFLDLGRGGAVVGEDNGMPPIAGENDVLVPEGSPEGVPAGISESGEGHDVMSGPDSTAGKEDDSFTAPIGG